ncbi:multidrug effflux MFS transporter [uncultured Hoeflea sp.]|jgi:MFS transporter, DHA1 family, multidrug resistance protein|uniref:multidrug effflux MFS transporter n=1 Tax=uncultured Hoeflea sp. TaxID=538666 RepID=UPI0030DB74B3|tara:strand:- start:944 stop:2170 length:1227 start_codon:yes stop_codon:yes gene_type:complete
MTKTVFLDRTTPPHIATLVVIAGLSALNMNLILPSLPGIATYYQADYALVQLAVSGYLAVTGLLQLIIGPLSDRYGRRPVLIVSLIIFLVATALTPFAPNIETFLAIRMLQAGVVSGMVLSRAIVRDIVGTEQAASMIGYVTMGMTLAPMVGPALGGVMEELFGWQSVFALLFIFGLAVLFLLLTDLGETNRNRSPSMLKQFGAYPELVRSRRFWGYSLTATFASGSFFSFLGGGPFVATRILDMQPSELGLYFMFIALGYMTGNFLSGRFASRIGLNRMMVTGCIISTFGMILTLVLFLAGFWHPLTFFGPIFFLGLGNGVTLPSANAGIVSVRPHLAGSASGLGGAMMIGGGAGLSALAGAILSAETGPYPLIFVMLSSCILSVLATLYVIHVENSLDADAKIDKA